MRKKKILCVLLAGLTLFFTGCQNDIKGDVTPQEPEEVPIAAVIENSELQYPVTNDLFYYEVYGDRVSDGTGYVAITKYLGDETLIKEEHGYTSPKYITIPDTIDGLPVYVIGPNAFSGASIETLKISKNVVSIGEKAFLGCQNLRNVEFIDVAKDAKGYTKGNGVVTIGASAFSECTKLTAIELPNSLESLGASAFFECTSLTKINIPEYVITVEKDVCFGCESLKDIYITDSTIEIEDSAFLEVAPDARIHGGPYSQSAHYAAKHFMLFVINREPVNQENTVGTNDSNVAETTKLS